MSSLFNSSSIRRLSGSPSTPAPPLVPDGDHKGSPSAAATTAPLPYQPRRRTPGGSTSSIPPPLALAEGSSAATGGGARAVGGASSSSPTTRTTFPLPPGVQVTSPTSSASTAATPTTTATTITRLFSNPVTPTTSTTDLSSSASLSASTDTITAALPSSSSASPNVASVSRANSSAKNATGRLQLTNLKATAQRALGLSNDSLGMKMLEALVQDGSTTAEWRAVVELLLDKKVTLLLPAAPAPTAEVTTSVVRDHLALVDLSEGVRDGGVYVLLKSGLVGSVDNDELSFQSYLPPDSAAFAALLDPLTRKAALASVVLPPPPTPPSSPSDSPSDPVAYPSVTPTLSSLLPFPPPSPPPSADSPSSPSASGKSNRRASLLPAAPRNPFAGLFGRPRAVSASPATPAPDTAAAAGTEDKPAAPSEEAEEARAAPESISMEVELKPTPPGSRPLSVRSTRSRSPSPARSTTASPALSSKELSVAAPEEEKEKDEKHAHLVSALGISVALKPADLTKALGKAWRARLAEELEDHSLPPAVVKSVQRFACLPLPPAGQAKSSSAPPSAFKKSTASAGGPTAATATLPALNGDPEVLAGGYQEFFALVHEELELAYRKEMVRALAAEEEHVREEKREEREREIEQRALSGVDAVEGCLARFHFNYLFSPENSSDRKHDEVLASRITALNTVGLTIDHLGAVTTSADGSRDDAVSNGVEALVKLVGEELQQISSPNNLSTKAKSQVLVFAHKMVIEGLRTLPPIRLRPEGEAMPSSTAAAEPTAAADASSAAPSETAAEVLTDPLSPVVQEFKKEIESDRASVQLDPLLVGGLEEAMSGSVLNLPSAPAADDGLASPSPLTTPDVSSPIAPSSPDPASSPPPAAAAAQSGSTSGADLLLPLIIYAVVKSNPPQLVSHLLYIQRYRPSFCFSGEGSYALVNLTAVVDFLENVNLDSLGLAGEGKLLSADFQSFDEAVSKDLAALSSPQAQAAAQSRLRGRVSQVSDFASMGLNNVAATGFGALRSLLENGQMAAEGFMIQVPGVANPVRPALLGRKTSGFSIANLATSVAGIAASAGRREGSIAGSSTASPAVGGPGEWGVKREMVDVSSRPGSVYERVESSVSGDEDGGDDDAHKSDPSDGEGEAGSLRKDSDARSIRSTRSVASTRSLGAALKADGTLIGSPASERLSISERFARMSTGGGIVPSSGTESPVGLGVASSLPKATPFLPAHKTRSASNSVSSLTPSTRRATILGGATFIPPPSPTRPSSTSSPADPSPPLSTTPSIPLPPLSQAHLPSSPLSTHSTTHVLPAIGDSARDKRAGSPHHIEHAEPGDGTVRPPVERFLACADAGELRVGDVAELLRDYQRLAGVLGDIGVWQ